MLSDSEIKAHFAEIDAMSPAERERHMRDVEQRLSPATKEHLPFLVRYAEDKTIEKFKKVLEDMVTEKRSKQVTKRFSPNDDSTNMGVVNKGVNNMQTIGKIYTKEHPEGIDEPEHSYKSFGELAMDVVHAGQQDSYVSDKLRNWQTKTTGYMTEGDTSGYLVPAGFSNRILSNSLESAIVRPRAQYMPLTSNRLDVPAAIDSDHSSSLFGGIITYHTSEGGQYTASQPTFGKVQLNLHKITGLCHVSDELLDDNEAGLETFLNVAFAQSITFKEDSLFLNGTGAAQPLGALNSANPALVVVNAISGQGAATVVAENLRDMWARMYPLGKRNSVWLYNPEVFGQLFSMSLATGVGGIPIWLPAGNNISNAPYATLFGRTLIETEHCQALGTAGDIALCDFSAYLIAGKGTGEPKFASSMHFRFDTSEQSFRWTLRLDGQSWWNSPMTPEHGTATLSPFIVLNSTRT